MTDQKAELKFDPLAMSPEQIRAEQAHQRVAAADGGVLLQNDPTKPPNQYHSSYQNYLFNSAGVHAKPAWSDSTKGRLAIRMISRGVVGAAAFTIGGRISRGQLADYNPETIELSLETIKEKPLQLLAKGFDATFGELIKGGVRGVGKLRGLEAEAIKQAEWNAVNFRTKAYYHTTPGLINSATHQSMNGRSLGAEMVSVSFDFAMASIGDASTRNFFQMIDPNIKKSWMVNHEGKMAKPGETSHFSPVKFVESFGRATWRVLSKNQGEDWAVALPYVYQMKAQRGMMTNLFQKPLKGSKIVFDNGWNGGAFKVNNEGKIIGDYQLAGAADLHMRFVGYNVYTLMFREGYDTVNNALKKWKETGYSMENVHLPQHINPVKSIVDGARYLIKSTIKANLYMNPAVLPFWLIRAPQTKWRGAMINVEAKVGENAIASKISYDARVENALANTATHGQFIDPHNPSILNFSTSDKRIQPGSENHSTMYLHNKEVPDPLSTMKDHHDPRIIDGYESTAERTFAKGTNWIGSLSNKIGNKATKLANKLPEGKFKDFLSFNEGRQKPDAEGLKIFMHNFVDASLSYTPYMFAKAELALRVDDRSGNGEPGKMDTAIYKFMDNVAAFKGHETWNAVKDIAHLATHVERKLISREGGEAKPEVMATPELVKKIPLTKVRAEGRMRDPIALARTPLDPVEQDKSDNRWANSVAARQNSPFLIEGNNTRH